MCNLMTPVFWSEWRPKSSIKFTMEIHDPEQWPRSYLIWHPKQKLILRNPGKMEGAGPLLPSYMGIISNHYKKPLLPISACWLWLVGDMNRLCFLFSCLRSAPCWVDFFVASFLKPRRNTALKTPWQVVNLEITPWIWRKVSGIELLRWMNLPHVFSWMLVFHLHPRKKYLLEPENGRLEEEISNL